jgi:hypothetical protein
MPTASRSSLLTIRLRPEARPQIPDAPVLSAADDIRDLRDQLAGFDDIEWIDDDTRGIVERVMPDLAGWPKLDLPPDAC